MGSSRLPSAAAIKKRQDLRRGTCRGEAKSSQELLPKYTEQDAKQGPSSQFAERAWGGLNAFSSSKELHWLGVRAERARIYPSLSVFMPGQYGRECHLRYVLDSTEWAELPAPERTSHALRAAL